MKANPITSIMTKDVVCVSPQQKIIDVKHIYEKPNFHHHIPVTENGKLVGMVSLIDFMYNIAGAGMKDDAKVYNELNVRDIMTRKPFFLTTKATIEEVAQALSNGYFHAVPILEEDNLVGIITTADVIKFFIKEKL